MIKNHRSHSFFRRTFVMALFTPPMLVSEKEGICEGAAERSRGFSFDIQNSSGEKMFRNTFQSGFLSILYSIG